MDEVARFLYEHPPFDQLPHEQVQRLAGIIQIEYFARGHDILVQDGPRSEFLYIVRRGDVELLRLSESHSELIDTLGEGECFGHVSVIRNSAPLFTVRASADTLAYLLPAARFQELLQTMPAVAQFFARSAAERLEFALKTSHVEAAPAFFRTHLRDLVQRPLLTIPPHASVRTAAQIMRDQSVSCLVVDGTPPGILTDRDLRVRVLAEGRSETTPVAEVMSWPALALPAGSLVFEGLLTMLERGIHHLPITEGDTVIGLVTHTDILRRQSRSPLFLPRQLDRAAGPQEFRAYCDQVGITVGALLDAGARVNDIGRVVALAHDALVARLLRDAETELGAPPCPYAWLTLGSQGRYEQTLRTDQDNALVYADDAPPEAEAYFAQLAGRVVEQLVNCGFPRCPGDIMATNARLRQPLRVWRGYFREWIEVPDEEALLHVAIFFDFRQISGQLDVTDILRAVIKRGADHRVFLARLARAALQHQPPLGFFRQLTLERSGTQRDLIDMKHRGTAPIVDLARVYALEAGFDGTNTLARLYAAGGNSSLSTTDAEELSAAFELISLLRLRYQATHLKQNQTPTNLTSISWLTPLERRELKDALRVVGRMQQEMAWTFQTGQLA